MAAAHAAVTGSHLRRNPGSKLTAKPLPVTQEVSSVLLLVVVEEEEEGLATALWGASEIRSLGPGPGGQCAEKREQTSGARGCRKS